MRYIGSYHVTDYAKGMRNTEFQEEIETPPGTYQLFAAYIDSITGHVELPSIPRYAIATEDEDGYTGLKGDIEGQYVRLDDIIALIQQQLPPKTKEEPGHIERFVARKVRERQAKESK